MVYDEQPEAVCVEPQSGPPNGLNTAPRLVTRIDPLETSATCRVGATGLRPAGGRTIGGGAGRVGDPPRLTS